MHATRAALLVRRVAPSGAIPFVHRPFVALASQPVAHSSSIHEVIGCKNGEEWLARCRKMRALIHPSEMQQQVTQNFQETDLTGHGTYVKVADSQTLYEVIFGWQANYIRVPCTLDGHFLGEPIPWSCEDLFREFYSARPGSRVLDLGCNTGKNLSHALKYGGPDIQVWGVEFSEDATDLAQRTHGADRIFQGDASADFVAERGWERFFSVVQCTAVIQHITPQRVEALLGNAARCLRPRGELLLTFKDAPTEQQLQQWGKPEWSQEVFTADLASEKQYLRDGYLRAAMWDDDYYPGVTSPAPPACRDVALRGIHRREFFFYSLEWIKARAAEHGLVAEEVEVLPDSKIPRSALTWKVVFRAA